MKVAVVTPYCQEPAAVLRQCHESVERQTYPCRHYLVADGHPSPEVADWQAEHFKLPRQHGDVGNAARCIGAMAAASDGFDAIAFLDADNWYHADHVASLVALHLRTGALVCTSGRDIHRTDGSLLIAGGESADGDAHTDTSCLWFHRDAFELLAVWATVPREIATIGDRIVWAAIKARNLPRAHSGLTTVAYRSRWQVHYRAKGETPPDEARPVDGLRPLFQAWEKLPEKSKQTLLFGYRGSPP